MSTIELKSKDAIQLWQEEVFGTYEIVDQVFVETWRWGNRYDVIIKDTRTGKLYSALVSVQGGDNYYISWEDYAVTFEEVEKIEKVTYEYKKVTS